MSFMVIPGDLAFYHILREVNSLFLNPRDIQCERLPLLKYTVSTTGRKSVFFLCSRKLFSYNFDAVLHVCYFALTFFILTNKRLS